MTDTVDCARAAADGAVFERVYPLGDLSRLSDVLASTTGAVSVRIAFTLSASGHSGAAVRVDAAPFLVCQRCMQAFEWRVSGGSDVEFAAGDVVDPAGELVQTQDGRVSLRELAEEELLLALPVAPACDTPLTCGNAPSETGGQSADTAGEMRRPFSALQDLLKKT